MGNTFGHLFRITTWGESHGGAVVWWSTAARHGSHSLKRIFTRTLTGAGDPVRVALLRNARKKMSVIFCQGCSKDRR
jgi:hypothetical protein